MEVSRGSAMEKLPGELKLKILENLSGFELVKLESVCSEWKALIRSSDNLWRKMCYKIIDQMPVNVDRIDLPPEGLYWKELFALWTVVYRNQLDFYKYYRRRDVYKLDLLFYQALPRHRPVRYYVEFGTPSSSSEILVSGPGSESSVNNVDTSDSGSSAYREIEVIIVD